MVYDSKKRTSLSRKKSIKIGKKNGAYKNDYVNKQVRNLICFIPAYSIEVDRRRKYDSFYFLNDSSAPLSEKIF